MPRTSTSGSEPAFSGVIHRIQPWAEARRAKIGPTELTGRAVLCASDRVVAVAAHVLRFPVATGRHLKDDTEAEPELALVDPLAAEVLHAGNRHEVLAVADVVVRRREVGMVREIERLQADLQLGAPD